MFVKIGKGSSSDFKNIRLDSGFRTKLLNLLQYRQLDNKACIFSCKKCSVVSLVKSLWLIVVIRMLTHGGM